APVEFRGLPMYIAGHSIGAAAAQREVSDHPADYKAAVLFGASVERRFNSSFPIPVVAVNAELDGLQRISRVAEAFFNQFDRRLQTIDHPSVQQHAIYIAPGMNHMQFADGVNPPSEVKRLDLKADIATAQAHDMVSLVVSEFLCLQRSACLDRSDSAAALVAKVQSTRTLLGPMIEAFRMEGSPNLFTPCNSDHPSPHCPYYAAWPPQANRTASPNTSCICGVPFSSVAANIMSGLDPSVYPLTSLDAIHDVSDTNPYHHPHVWSNCSLALASTSAPCAMNSTTVSMVIYPDDKNDSGFAPATADEIRVKMASRQVYALNSVDPNATLASYDSGSICAQINQESYTWALSVVSPAAMNRFQQYGQPMVMMDDGAPVVNIGPFFVNSKVEFKDAQQDGRWVRQVKAYGFKTDYRLTGLSAIFAPPDSNGYHYCKVLSPARAMEWILVDGLRKNKGI
ncbi:hypothetical protein HDV03_002828, partial [Kappamyces sp. JEL0829]